MYRCGNIQRGPAGKLLAGPEIFVPLSSLYPLTGRRLSGPLSYQVSHFIFVYGSTRVDIVGAIGGFNQVNMGINEAGQYSFAVQVYQFGVSTPYTPYFVIVAHRHNAPAGAIDGHSLCSRLRGIHSVDCTVQIKYRCHPSYPSMRTYLEMRACNVASHYTSCQQARSVVP